MTEKMDATAQLDQKLTQKALEFLKPLTPMTNTLDNIRRAADNGTPLPTSWPYQSVFVATNALVSIYTQLKMSIAAANGQDLSDPQNSQEIMDQYIVEPSLMSVLVPWIKTRTIVHVNHKEFSDELLNVNSKIFTTNPQWATFFDIKDLNIAWDGMKIEAVGFARYFFGPNPGIPSDECQVTVQGEPGSVVNNMICIFLDEHGDFILGPFIPINDQFSILEQVNKSNAEILDNLKLENMPAERFEQMQQSALDTLERTKSFFKILIYFLQNQDKLTDQNGMVRPLPKNPMSDQLPAQHTTVLYMD